jgi:hypothetical protein
MKMRKIFLHIGAGKTGTSALQSFFAINKKNLEKYNIFYPYSENEEKAKQFKITNGNAKELANLLIDKNIDKEKIKKYLNNDIKESKEKHILYSSERLHHFREENMKIFKDIADKNRYEIIIIYYIRSIIDHLVSFYHQLIKQHLYTKSFNEYIKEFNSPFVKNIDKLLNLFDKENIIIKNYKKVTEMVKDIKF